MKKGDAKTNYRQQLLSARSDLLFSLGAKAESIASLGRVNEDDQAQASHEEFISLRLNGLDYQKLRMVEEALDRLDSGEYGLCLACDEPISPRRLEALPWARYCVHCQDQASVDFDERPARLLEVVTY
ncbi:MAG: TraR/DksA family transcriptional regulator [Bryobacteraceae bacterium]|nr:TraR/DksA family transcriptional regulator [Bryobacteraceae bacterium]